MIIERYQILVRKRGLEKIFKSISQLTYPFVKKKIIFSTL